LLPHVIRDYLFNPLLLKFLTRNHHPLQAELLPSRPVGWRGH
jgi:hypothetical protein